MGTEYILTANGELYHWGIKGMKWGVRRYQNKDGSLTPAGKKRYAEEEANLKAREKTIKARERTNAKIAKLEAKKAELDEREKALNPAKKGNADDSGTSSQVKEKPKASKPISTDELREKVNRLQLEKQYHQLQAELNPKKKNFMEDLGKKALNDLLVPATINVGKNYLEKTLKKKLGLDTEDALTVLEKEVRMLEAQKKKDRLKSGKDDRDLDSAVSELVDVLNRYDAETLKSLSAAKTQVNNILGKKKDKD